MTLMFWNELKLDQEEPGREPICYSSAFRLIKTFWPSIAEKLNKKLSELDFDEFVFIDDINYQNWKDQQNSHPSKHFYWI